VLIAFPGLVTGNLDKVESYDLKAVGEQMQEQLSPDAGEGGYGSEEGSGAAEPASPEPSAGAEPAAKQSSQEDDPMKAMQDALKQK